jgi:hypothetical protein
MVAAGAVLDDAEGEGFMEQPAAKVASNVATMARG